ncbi:MAG: universal stress protein [Acidobacteria bacterium]|nr:universal stress protein [Acidobacteriota bacterium]
MIEIQRILCPIDFSEFSRRALDHALAIARWYGSAVTVLHVFPMVPTAAYAPGLPVFEIPLLTSQQRDQAIAEMQRFVAAEAAPNPSIGLVVRDGPAASEILSQARAMRSDLLVLGTHGRSGFERLVLGSVAEKVLRKAECPVLTVPRALPDAVPSSPVIFKRLLCAVDFSDSSMHALRYALSLAQEADAHLTVLHVREDEADEGAGARLEAAIPDAVRAYCTPETLVARGKPYRQILRVAEEQASDVIVLGVHGRGAVDLMFFGSTTQHVVRQAACPVLTLRAA